MNIYTGILAAYFLLAGIAIQAEEPEEAPIFCLERWMNSFAEANDLKGFDPSVQDLIHALGGNGQILAAVTTEAMRFLCFTEPKGRRVFFYAHGNHGVPSNSWIVATFANANGEVIRHPEMQALGRFVPGRSPRVISYFPGEGSGRSVNKITQDFDMECYERITPPAKATHVVIEVRRRHRNDQRSTKEFELRLPISAWQ